MDKISFGVILIRAVKMSLTFKLQKTAMSLDVEQTGGGTTFGAFITNFASIKNASLTLDELMIMEGFLSQEQLVANLVQHYKT